MMEEGSADIIIGVKDTPDRKKYIQFLTTPYRQSSSKVFYLQKGKGSLVKEYDDLYQLRVIGIKIGAKYFKRFNQDPKLNKHSVISNTQNFHMLQKGRVDAVIIAEDQGEFLISTLGLREEFEKSPYFYKDSSPRFVGISKKSQHINKLEAFDIAMRQISESGQLEQIMIEHFFKKYKIPQNALNWK